MVTGGTGFIGRALINELLKNSINVTMLGKFKNDEGNKRIRKINWALGNDFPDCCSGSDDNWPLADAIIHLAHQWDDKSGALSLNHTATRTLFASARKAGIRRLIFASSVSSSAEAKNNYGQIKWQIEQDLTSDIFVPVRIGLVYGGSQASQWGMLCKLVRFTPILPMLNPRQLVQPIHVSEVANGLIKLALTSELRQSEYVLAASKPVMFASFLEKLANICFGRRIKVIPIPALPVLFALECTKHLPGIKNIKEKVLGLLGLPVLETKKSLDELSLTLMDIDEGLAKDTLNQKRLIKEAYIVLSSVLGARPSFFAIRSYIRGVNLWDNGIQVGMPFLARLHPQFLRLYDPVFRSLEPREMNGTISGRIYLAALVLEASDIAPEIYSYVKIGIFWAVVRGLKILVQEALLLPIRVVISWVKKV